MSEAQATLDYFFHPPGHGGGQESSATLEFRIVKKAGSAQLELVNGTAANPKGGMQFTDLLWPERVLSETKSREENLERDYDPAFVDWRHIIPHRPPFVILRNLDQFWIYELNPQLFDAVDLILLHEPRRNPAALNFLLPVPPKPVIGNSRIKVTQLAADSFANVFDTVAERSEVAIRDSLTTPSETPSLAA